MTKMTFDQWFSKAKLADDRVAKVGRAVAYQIWQAAEQASEVEQKPGVFEAVAQKINSIISSIRNAAGNNPNYAGPL